MKPKRFIVLCALCLSAAAMFAADKITLNYNDAQLGVVLKELTEQSGYTFVYSDQVVKETNSVTINVKDVSIRQAMDVLVDQMGFSYRIEGKKIYLNKKSETRQNTNRRNAQVGGGKIKVNGRVFDPQGEPIIGASVLVKGTKTGVASDLNGEFSIEVPQGGALVVSYLGYKTITQQVGNKSQIDITMEEDVNMLSEVVAIGYGTVKRKDLTGSVASVNSKELMSVPTSDPLQAMQGKLAGVHIATPEGNPDAEITIRVRGGGSITGDNTPLYIVDGFPVSSISDIPTSDIESIDVLKDVSSTAIYGSRGSNGIVLVTTKSGKAGKVQVNYNAYVGFKKAAQKVDVLDMEDYLKWQYENFALKGDLSTFTDVFGSYTGLSKVSQDLTYYDWQDEIYGRTGNTFNHNVNISGGNEKVRFMFGYNHINEKGIVMNSTYKRDNLNLKLDATPSKTTKLEFSARYSRAEINGEGQTALSGSLTETAPVSSTGTGNVSRTSGNIRSSIVKAPLILGKEVVNGVTLDDNNIDDGVTDPVTALMDSYMERRRQEFNLNGSFQWEIIKNLTLRTEFGLSDYRNKLHTFAGTSTYESQYNTLAAYKNMPLTNNTNLERRTFRNTNTLRYDFAKLLPEEHSLDILFGEEMISNKEILTTSRIEGFPTFYDANMAFKFSAQGTPVKENEFYEPDDNMLSFFGRVNYAYKEKYLFAATLRADGSNKFSKDNRWGYFPSVSGAWRIISEKWMAKTQNWLSNLKLRASYGVSGNNNIPIGQNNKTYSIAQAGWLNITSSWLSPGTSLNNPDLKWETTHSINVGLDFGFFNNRLNGTVDIYKNNVKDLLMEMQIGGSGYNTQYQNVGETENKGVELTLNYVAVNKNNFGLDLSLTFAHNVNKVKSLGTMKSFTKVSHWADTEVGYDYIVRPGSAVGTMMGYKTLGRYEVDDFEGYDATTGKWILKEGQPDVTSVVGLVRPGTLKLADIDGDGVVNDNDKVEIGDANPFATGGFVVNSHLYGFDLNANFTYSIGNDVYNAAKLDQTSTRGSKWHTLSSIMASGSRWTNIDENGNLVNDADKLAAMNANTTLWSPYSTKACFHSWGVEDGSFLRLSNITLGYTIDKKFTHRFGIENLRFYFTASNLFCITGYSGVDPEADCKREYYVTPGVDYYGYPKNRQYVFGLNLTF